MNEFPCICHSRAYVYVGKFLELHLPHHWIHVRSRDYINCPVSFHHKTLVVPGISRNSDCEHLVFQVRQYVLSMFHWLK